MDAILIWLIWCATWDSLELIYISNFDALYFQSNTFKSSNKK